VNVCFVNVLRQESKFKEFISERLTLFQRCFKAKNETLKVEKKVSHFYFTVFLWASVGFEMNHWINFHKRWNTLREILVVFRRWQVPAETVRVGYAGVGRLRGMDAGFKVCGLEVCGCRSVTRFPKFLLVRTGFKLCGAGASNNLSRTGL